MGKAFPSRARPCNQVRPINKPAGCGWGINEWGGGGGGRENCFVVQILACPRMKKVSLRSKRFRRKLQLVLRSLTARKLGREQNSGTTNFHLKSGEPASFAHKLRKRLLRRLEKGETLGTNLNGFCFLAFWEYIAPPFSFSLVYIDHAR